MTDSQRELLRSCIDLNWEIDQTRDIGTKFELAAELSRKKAELRQSMGAQAYEEFMQRGREMFASKK